MSILYFRRCCKTGIFLTLLLAMSARLASAQAGNYTFAPVAGTYAGLVASATPVAAVQADDAVSAPLPLGFTFVFDGNIYTQVVASSNGFLSFNPAATAANINSLDAASAAVRPLLAPLWDNLSGTSGTARAAYETTGAAGSRVFTFEWRDWKWNQAAAAGVVSFQVKLYEGSNVVEYTYQPSSTAPVAPTASIGLDLAGGTGGGSFLSLSDAGASPTVSSVVENASIGTRPASGQVYRFTPGAFACAAPLFLTASNFTGTGVTLAFAGSAGATGYTLTYTPVGGAPQTVTTTASPVSLTGLTPATNYTASVVANCNGSPATLTFNSSNLFSYCQANLGGGNCAANDVTSAVQIIGTTLNNTTNNCSSANGSSYASFPATGSTTATLSGSATYSIRVTHTTYVSIGMWIDYDQNGTFDASEFTSVVNVTRANVPATASFTVPAGARPGLTKLRVRTNGPNGISSSISAADACTQFPSGQTEDYIVGIAPPSPCAAVTGAGASGITATTANLTFTPNPAATSYTVTYTATGGPAQTTTASGSPAALSGLLPGTGYVATIVGTCPSGTSVPVTVIFDTTPANDDCANAVLLPVQATCSPTAGTTTGATQSLPVTPTCGTVAPTAADVWYRFVAPTSSLVLSLTGSNQFSGAIDVRTGTCAASTSIFCGRTQPNLPLNQPLTGLVAGSTYFVRVYPSGAPSGNDTFTICLLDLPTTPANDDCTAALPLPVTADCSAPTTGTVAGATQSIAPTATQACNNSTTARDVWYRFTATTTAHVLGIDSQFGAVAEMRIGPCTAGTGLGCAVATPGGPRQVVVRNLVVGQVYFVRVYSFNGSPVGPSATFTLCLTAVPANDEPCGAVPLTSGVPVTSTNYGASATVLPGITQPLPCAPGVPTPRDVWFAFTPTSSFATVAVGGTAAGLVRLYTAATCSTGFILVDCQLVSAANPPPYSYLGLTAGQRYYLAVAGNSNIALTGSFSIVMDGVLASRASADARLLQVFPNPSRAGSLTLRLNTPHAAGQSILLNALGQAVMQQALPAGVSEHTLSVRGLAAGIYTLRVALDGRVLTQKVVLE